MRRLVASSVILIFVVSLSFAQGKMQEKGEQSGGQMEMMGQGMMGMQGGMSPTMCNMIVHHVFMKANTLNLTDAQRKEVSTIRERYIYPMTRKEADFKISHMKVMDMLQDPNFDPTKVKAEVKASNDINLEMANMSVDALTAIRKAIGVENFKKAAEMVSMMGGGMRKEGTIVEEEHKH